MAEIKQDEPRPKIVVTGAGVIGLTTALLLARKHKYDISIVAKHMPGDLDIEYASPWAGANYMPFSPEGSRVALWERDTWPELERLAREHPESGIHFQDNLIFGRTKDEKTAGKELVGHMLDPSGPWFKSYMPNFRFLEGKELNGFEHGIGFGSVCINTGLYLNWLLSQCLLAGIKVQRGILHHITEAASGAYSNGPADIVVNCTGLSSFKLGGVEDKNLIPVRGQTVLVRNSPGVMAGTSGTDDGDSELTYIMERAAGGGTILGGCYQKGNWAADVDPNLATRIMKRAVDVIPALTGGKGGIENLDVVRHNVGLRPSRNGGPRVEKEMIGGVEVVHNYGHGGFGYQASYGCCAEVVDLVEEVFEGRRLYHTS